MENLTDGAREAALEVRALAGSDCPVPTAGSSQMPITPAPGDATPSSGF